MKEGAYAFAARADAGQPQFLGQPVLQRLVRAFHASLGLARVGTECVDIEIIQRPAELRDAFACRLRALLHVEDAGLVAVERHRLAVRVQILRQCSTMPRNSFYGYSKSSPLNDSFDRKILL